MSATKVLLGVVVGVAVGAAIGILLAPDSGVNTRKKISKKGQDYVDDMKGRFNSYLDGFMHHAESVKDDVSEYADRAKSKVESVKRSMTS